MTSKFCTLLLSASLAATPMISFADAAKDPNASGAAAGSADQTDNNFYWQGTQLYNLGRLGEAFESFEKAIQRKQNSKEAEAYLIQIRQEIVTNAKKRSDEKTLNYGGGTTPESALNIVYLQKGSIKVTLQAKYLFDENTASLKANSMDVINRLAELLSTKEGNNVELTMIDELDETGMAKNIDAERALVVFALVNFKKLADDNANGAS